MSTLRRATIRLAAQRPDLRPHLLPLLGEARVARDKVALKIREFKKLLGKGQHFAILTPYGPGSKSENKRRMSEFMRDLQAMGYGGRTEKLKGSWEGVRENAVLVKGMRFKDAIDLGRKYRQDAIIYKDPTGTLGMYYTKDGTAEIAVEPTGDIAVDISTNPELYSKGRGMSFEFGVLWGQKVPWDGRTPIKRKDVERWVEKGVVSP